MKTLKILLATAVTMGLCAPAMAAPAGSVTGEVDVIGHVNGLCSVIVGQGTSTSFQGSIDLGNLAGADGKLLSGLNGSAGPFTVVCNSGAPHISLAASSLVGSLAPADASYTNVVNYRASLGLGEVSNNSETFYANSQNTATPTATTATLAHALSGNTGNITVGVDTVTSANAILTAGTYGATNGGAGGTITIVISPS
jgi:hypothetical protein